MTIKIIHLTRPGAPFFLFFCIKKEAEIDGLTMKTTVQGQDGPVERTNTLVPISNLEALVLRFVPPLFFVLLITNWGARDTQMYALLSASVLISAFVYFVPDRPAFQYPIAGLGAAVVLFWGAFHNLASLANYIVAYCLGLYVAFWILEHVFSNEHERWYRIAPRADGKPTIGLYAYISDPTKEAESRKKGLHIFKHALATVFVIAAIGSSFHFYKNYQLEKAKQEAFWKHQAQLAWEQQHPAREVDKWVESPLPKETLDVMHRLGIQTGQVETKLVQDPMPKAFEDVFVSQKRLQK